MSMINQQYLQDQEIKKLQSPIAIVTILLSSFGIFLTILFFIFNIRYRNFRLIKMSSPNINNIINFNCVLLYLCPIFNSIKGLNISNELVANLMCQLNAWIIPLSSTAIYAAMLAKAWRIYKIFDTTPKVKKIVIKDLRLVVYILCMMFIDAIVLIIWQSSDTIKIKPRYVYEIQSQPSQIFVPLYTTKFTTNQPINVSSLDIVNSFENYLEENKPNLPINPIIRNFSQQTNQLKILFECNSNFNEVWITLLTMYKIILLMYGIYLAWIIRNINVPSMNDSKYLLLSTYTIIICGLGSMTLMQLLRDWPDVVQAFFSIGITLSTCTTQCLLFIPKIRLWFKRKNDDNFKISLSQVFLQSSSSCYYTDKQNRNSNMNNANMLNLEDELCELLHENSQLKNFLKEKEEIIKILQEKIRTTKANLFHVYSDKQNKTETDISKNDSNFNRTNFNSTTIISTDEQNNSAMYFSPSIDQSPLNRNIPLNNLDSGFDIDTSTSTTTTTTETFRTIEIQRSQKSFTNSKQNLINPNTEQLKNDLDEVEELTTRVRDSISIDLSNTRRYSPLLYEYYRKQLELAKSIQCTYNIQCNTLFDAMTLMRKCLKDYCQTVHNPEYLAIDDLNQSNINNHYTFNDYLNKNNLNKSTSNEKVMNQSQQSNTFPNSKFLNDSQEFSVYSSVNNLKKNYNNNMSHFDINQTKIKPIIETGSSNSSSSTSSTASTSSISITSLNNNTNKTNESSSNVNFDSKSKSSTQIDNKQTYV